MSDPSTCTCWGYVVDYSDPDRYHPENIDVETDPDCPVHGRPLVCAACQEADHRGCEPVYDPDTGEVYPCACGDAGHDPAGLADGG